MAHEESPPPPLSEKELKAPPPADVGVGEVLNASGHVQELDRNFSLLAVASVGITTGNTWAALGGSIVIAIYNGGPPGVIYEFLAVSFFYWCIAALIAELASSIPSSAGVYHWATVTGGKRYGKVLGFFAGWWNTLAWAFGASSMALILSNQIVAMYGLFHPEYAYERWQVYVTYLIINWLACAVILFGNRVLPVLNQVGLFFILAGVFITIVVCAAMPSTNGTGHATSAFVWRDFVNSTGYSSSGFAFLMGMLNGAYAVGTPDCVSHLAEEIPNPRINVPKAIAAQMVTGLFTALFYLIAIFYSVQDLDALLETGYTFPLAELYFQATGTKGGSQGLLIVIFLPTVCTLIGCTMTAGRMLWTLARDDATPLSGWIGSINKTWKNPFNATVAIGVINTVMGAIYVGSLTAFNAFVGSFVVLSTLSYLAAILPHYLSRKRNVPPGPFELKGILGYILAFCACSYIIVFTVIYCFPYAMPVDVQTMNYTCVTVGGFTILIAGWWFWKSSRGYVGPQVVVGEDAMASETLRQGSVSSMKA